jgi:DNA replication protein DnaD
MKDQKNMYPRKSVNKKIEFEKLFKYFGIFISPASNNV